VAACTPYMMAGMRIQFLPARAGGGGGRGGAARTPRLRGVWLAELPPQQQGAIPPPPPACLLAHDAPRKLLLGSRGGTAGMLGWAAGAGHGVAFFFSRRTCCIRVCGHEEERQLHKDLKIDEGHKPGRPITDLQQQRRPHGGGWGGGQAPGVGPGRRRRAHRAALAHAPRPAPHQVVASGVNVPLQQLPGLLGEVVRRQHCCCGAVRGGVSRAAPSHASWASHRGAAERPPHLLAHPPAAWWGCG